MSYPPIRYRGDAGESTARFRPASAPPDFTTPSGDSFRYLATGRGTDGDYGLYQVDLGPGVGTSTHFHRTISEGFYVLTGTLRLFDGERWVDAGPGDFAHVAAGGLHAFHNTSGGRTTMLMLFTPGAPREGYFEGLADLPGLTTEERREFFLRHDSYFVDEGGGPTVGRDVLR